MSNIQYKQNNTHHSRSRQVVGSSVSVSLGVGIVVESLGVGISVILVGYPVC